MAREHGMIEPFEDRQVRERRRLVRPVVVRLRHPRRRRVQGVHEHQQHADRSEELRPAVVRRHQGGHLHRAAELVRAGADDRVLPHPARRADGLPRQVHLRALRHHRQRDAVRAGVGRARRRSRSRTRRRCRRRSTPTKASRRCCSSRATSRARCRTPTRRASISSSWRSRCRGSDGHRLRATRRVVGYRLQAAASGASHVAVDREARTLRLQPDCAELKHAWSPKSSA